MTGKSLMADTTRTPNPLIIVMSGPSGAGKDSVIKRLMEIRNNIHFVVTATSRAKRPGEVDGKDYIFVTREEFESMIERNEFLEHASVYGDYKGVPKKQISEYVENGFDVVLRVDIQGVVKLREVFGDSAVFVLIVADSAAELEKRLSERKTETAEEMVVRMGEASKEVKQRGMFEYEVVNVHGKLEDAVKVVESIIAAEKARVRQRSPVKS